MKRILRPVLIVIAILAGCILISATMTALVLDWLHTDIPASARNPPVYPNAREVRIEDGYNESKTIAFVTADDPADVVAFYAETLREDGWFKPLFGPDYKFEWHQAGPDGPTDTAFNLTVLTTPLPEGMTHVQVSVIKYDPR